MTSTRVVWLCWSIYSWNSFHGSAICIRRHVWAPRESWNTRGCDRRRPDNRINLPNSGWNITLVSLNLCVSVWVCVHVSVSLSLCVRLCDCRVSYTCLYLFVWWCHLKPHAPQRRMCDFTQNARCQMLQDKLLPQPEHTCTPASFEETPSCAALVELGKLDPPFGSFPSVCATVDDNKYSSTNKRKEEKRRRETAEEMRKKRRREETEKRRKEKRKRRKERKREKKRQR